MDGTTPLPAGLPPERMEALGWAFGASADLVLAVGPDGRVAFANAAAKARWATAEGALATDLLPAEARAAGEAAMAEAFAGTPARFEWGELGPGGPRCWFAAAAAPLRVGQTTYALLTSTDRTEEKRSELRLRRSEQLLVDTAGVAHLGTWEWTITEPNATWSDELYRIYGLTPETYTPSYEKYLTMIHPDDRQRVIDATNRVFHEHVPYSHDERIFRPDGSVRYLHTWAYPVLDDAGKLTKLVGVCQDITDRKLAEEEVRRLNEGLERRVAERTHTIEQSLRDLEAFQAMLSHDLRAPLSVIQGSCALLTDMAKEPLPPSAKKDVERIKRSVVHMTRLVEDLLTLAHVGNTSLERSVVDVSALAADVLGHLAREDAGRRVSTFVEPGLTCHADAGLLRTVLENLLGNAWKYSSRVEHARIEVGAVDHEGGQTFFVRDNGAGFDMKEADRLFVPFERLHKASDFKGTGVGLAAVHRIIERHGGRIWAESAPGAGATFHFTVDTTPMLRLAV